MAQSVILTDCAVESELCRNSSVPPFGALLRKRAVGAADVSVEQTASWAAASWITEAIRASGAVLQRPLMAPCDTPLPSARKRRVAEYLVRKSLRGLGRSPPLEPGPTHDDVHVLSEGVGVEGLGAVSYTHLTLPTICSV